MQLEILSRRKRFAWTEEYEDLLHDAVAVIRARCKGKGRGIAWGPIESIFPTLGSSSLRTRYQKWIVQPGARNYMEKLVCSWYNLWKLHQGRPELPDDDPSKPEGCDLTAHIEFLRDYLDKKNL